MHMYVYVIYIHTYIHFKPKLKNSKAMKSITENYKPVMFFVMHIRVCVLVPL